MHLTKKIKSLEDHHVNLKQGYGTKMLDKHLTHD